MKGQVVVVEPADEKLKAELEKEVKLLMKIELHA